MCVWGGGGKEGTVFLFFTDVIGCYKSGKNPIYCLHGTDAQLIIVLGK